MHTWFTWFLHRKMLQIGRGQAMWTMLICMPSVWISEKLITSLKSYVCCSETWASNALATQKSHWNPGESRKCQERSDLFLSPLSNKVFHNPVWVSSLCLLLKMKVILTPSRFLPRCFLFFGLIVSMLYKSSNEFKTQHKNKDCCH